jgi:GntR family transcriptional repressor for pyruvate dehydrogenase complex
MSITDDALTRLRDMILSGELKPGTRLPPEQELAAQLGVSRGSMREAVRALTYMRLIEVRRGLGTFVTGLDPASLLEGVRRLLEPAATGVAATRITAAGLDELRGHLDAMRAAEHDPAEFMRHDQAFHDRIAHAAGNPWLEALLKGLTAPTIQVRTRHLREGEQIPGLRIAQHEQIVSAIEAGDSPLAEAASLMHIASTAEGLRALLSQELEG